MLRSARKFSGGLKGQIVVSIAPAGFERGTLKAIPPPNFLPTPTIKIVVKKEGGFEEG